MDVDWQKAARDGASGKSTQAALSRAGVQDQRLLSLGIGQRQIRISELVRLWSLRHSQYRAALNFSGQSRPVTARRLGLAILVQGTSR